MDYKIIDNTPIKLSHCELDINDVLTAAQRTNSKFEKIRNRTKAMDLDVFSVLDFRVFSGLVGETFVVELASMGTNLLKNPSLDGYPDLLQASTPEMNAHVASCSNKDFITYKYGGLEVKNTFGTKKSGAFLLSGDQRISAINNKLDWKAHHQQTNYLIALFTDYINQQPIIAAIFYSDTLEPEDWTAVQKPKLGSGMTSFSAITTAGFKKLKSGLKICLNDDQYLTFFT